MKATFIILVFIKSSFALTCFEKGECLNSYLLDVAETESPQQCLVQCKQTQGCNWFTLNPFFNHCELFSDCLTFSEASCPECISGEVGCSAYNCNIPGRCQVSPKIHVSSKSLTAVWLFFRGMQLTLFRPQQLTSACWPARKQASATGTPTICPPKPV